MDANTWRDHEVVDRRAGLLVSVRDADEANIALAGGADFIDIKEPSRGSLGAADPCVVAEMIAAVAHRAPISVAVGELREWSAANASATAAALFGSAVLIKFGLAGCGTAADWTTRWHAAIASLGDDVRPVAVVYADWQAAAAPPPEEIFAAGVTKNCAALLVDTWDKSGGTLFDHWSTEEVASFCDRARETGMIAVLAGSLNAVNLQAAFQCGADMVAVRGAVCDGSRNGSMSLARVQTIRALIDDATAQPVGGVSDADYVLDLRKASRTVLPTRE